MTLPGVGLNPSMISQLCDTCRTNYQHLNQWPSEECSECGEITKIAMQHISSDSSKVVIHIKESKGRNIQQQTDFDERVRVIRNTWCCAISVIAPLFIGVVIAITVSMTGDD